MKSYHVGEFTGTAGLVLREEAVPRAGAHEVLIRIRASSLNFRDGMLLNGAFGPLVQPGVVPLSDGAGEVAEVGAGVTRFKQGDRVMPIFNPHWIGGQRPTEMSKVLGLGAGQDGTLREYMVVNEEAAVAIPAYLSFEEAASLPCAAVTAWCALVGGGIPLYPGETVLTLGTGGVSIFALQFAKLFGARVISTTSSDAKAERLKSLGADHTINYRATPDWENEVRRLTGGLGADLVVEVGGAGTLARSFRSVNANSRIAIVGLLAGANGGEGFDFMSWIATTYRTATGSRQHFEQMTKAMAYHELHPVLDRSFALEEAPAAFAHFLAQKHVGKVIIRHN